MSTTKLMKHIAGPWRVSKPIGEGDFGILSQQVNAGGNFYVATLPNGSHGEAEANARLIAAAPELLSLIVELEENALSCNCDNECDGTCYKGLARAAIILAEGKQP